MSAASESIVPSGLRAVGGASMEELLGQRGLLWNLTLRELRSKYKRSALGWFWSLLNPLSSIIIYSVVFGSLLKLRNPTGDPSGLKSFTLWLTCALLPWNFFATAIGAGTGSLVGNAALMKKVYFPREYLVASTVLSWLVSFVIEMVVLVIVFAFTGHIVVQWLPLVLVVAAFQAILGFGFALALSALNVYFRDIQHLIGIALQVWFYLTPVVYQITIIPKHWLFVYKLNPLVHFATAYRNLLYDGRIPGAQSIVYIVASSFIALVVGAWVFRRLEPRMVEEL